VERLKEGEWSGWRNVVFLKLANSLMDTIVYMLLNRSFLEITWLIRAKPLIMIQTVNYDLHDKIYDPEQILHIFELG
jgi:hypothetical protein